MSRYLAALVGVLLPLVGLGLGAQVGLTPCPPDATPAAQPAGPPPLVSIILPGHGQAVPGRCGHSHTGTGNIDIAQQSGDTVTVTMTGVAAAGANPCTASVANMNFDLNQDFEVSFDSPKLKKANLVIGARHRLVAAASARAAARRRKARDARRWAPAGCHWSRYARLSTR